MSQGNATIILVTDCNPQTQLFMEYIAERLDCPISAVAPHDTQETLESGKTLILLDADHVDESSMQQWHTKAAESESMTLAAINLRDEDHAADVLSSLHLKHMVSLRNTLHVCRDCIPIKQDLSREVKYSLSREVSSRVMF